MKKEIRILIVILILCSCGRQNLEDTKSEKYNKPNLKSVYFQKGCNGDVCGYYHTVMLDKYDEEYFNDYDFVYLADIYLDSVKNNYRFME